MPALMLFGAYLFGLVTILLAVAWATGGGENQARTREAPTFNAGSRLNARRTARAGAAIRSERVIGHPFHRRRRRHQRASALPARLLE
jgi:hypothetical protein